MSRTGTKGQRLRADRVTRLTVGDAAEVFLLPLVLFRIVGAQTLVLLAVPLTLFLIMQFVGDTMWERPTFRNVRLLIRAERQGEARTYRKHMVLFGTLAGVAVTVLMLLLHSILYGEYAQRFGNRLLLLILAPALICVGAAAGKKGFLRAVGAGPVVRLVNMLKTILLLVFPCLFGGLAAHYGSKVDALLLTDRYASIYGMSGVLAGISLTEVIVLILFLLSERRYRAQDLFSMRGERGSGYAFLSLEGLFALIIPAVICFDLWDFFRGTPAEEMTAAEFVDVFGRYIGCAIAPTLFAGCLLTIPFILPVYQVHAGYQHDDIPSALDRFAGMVRHAMITLLPAAFSICALAVPLVTLFIGHQDDDVSLLMRVQILAAPLFTMSLILSILFQKFGGLKILLIAAAAGSAVHIGAVFIAAAAPGAYAYLIAHFAGILVFLVVTGLFLSASLSYRQEWVHGFLIPCISALIPALPLFALAPALSTILGELLTILILAPFYLLIYVILLTMLHGVTEYELYHIPGGRILTGLVGILGGNR